MANEEDVDGVKRLGQQGSHGGEHPVRPKSGILRIKCLPSPSKQAHLEAESHCGQQWRRGHRNGVPQDAHAQRQPHCGGDQNQGICHIDAGGNVIQVHGPRVALDVLHDQGGQHHKRHNAKGRHAFRNGSAKQRCKQLEHRNEPEGSHDTPRKGICKQRFFRPLPRRIRRVAQKRLVGAKPHEGHHSPDQVHGVGIGPVVPFCGVSRHEHHRRKSKQLRDDVGRHHPMAVTTQKCLDVIDRTHASNKAWVASNKVKTEALFMAFIVGKSRTTVASKEG